MSTLESERWAQALSGWAIPSEIAEQAPENPWIHPPVLFQVPERIESTFSHACAREALPSGGSLLDVGCGGGIAAFAVVPPASHLFGVDHQSEMLEMFTANALSRGVSSEVFEGFWPEVAPRVPNVDVVLSHHVAYNVADIGPFLSELDSHAKLRVVIEIPTHHPLTNISDAWKYFWNLDRPTTPTAADLVDVLREIGITAQSHYWSGPLRDAPDFDQESEILRIRLCLPPGRLGEVKDFLLDHPMPRQRDLATIWWDVNDGI
ncbi:MAG: methyltransferase domain-containing protein [Actinobacteria bacterium]|nr:methyltransferase domain-containing protein [Actinomycetota bacterium]